MFLNAISLVYAVFYFYAFYVVEFLMSVLVSLFFIVFGDIVSLCFFVWSLVDIFCTWIAKDFGGCILFICVLFCHLFVVYVRFPTQHSY